MNRLMITSVILVCVGCNPTTETASNRPNQNAENKNLPSSEVQQITLVFDTGFNDTLLNLVISDPTKIKKLVLDPMEHSKPDPNPANYEVMADVHWTNADGTEDYAFLFFPWGPYKHNGEYRIADFSALKSFLGEVLEDLNYRNSLEKKY